MLGNALISLLLLHSRGLQCMTLSSSTACGVQRWESPLLLLTCTQVPASAQRRRVHFLPCLSLLLPWCSPALHCPLSYGQRWGPSWRVPCKAPRCWPSSWPQGWCGQGRVVASQLGRSQMVTAWQNPPGGGFAVCGQRMVTYSIHSPGPQRVFVLSVYEQQEKDL